MRSSALIATALALVGCDHHLYSPPARALPLESVAPVGQGRVGVALEGAAHGEAVFGPSLSSGASRLRVSPHEDVDVSLEGHVIHVQGNPASDIDQNIYSLRVGAKYSALSWLALAAGLGGGLHAAGTFASPDLGVLVAYENRYAVPCLALRAFVSEPLRPRAVDTSEAGELPGTHVGRPRTTGGFATSLGLRVPMPPSFDPSEGVRGSLLVAPGITYLADEQQEMVLLQVGGGGEITF